MWGKVTFWLRLGAVVFVALVGIGAFMRQAGYVSFHPVFESWVWGVGLVVLAVDNAGTLAVRGVHAQRLKREKDIESALMSMLIILAKSKKLRFEELGASVYVPKRRRDWSNGKAHRHLKRIHRFRPAGFPPKSGIAWHSGAGTVGDCWRDKKTTYWDGTAIARSYPSEKLANLTDESFNKISTRTRQGFSLEQFRNVTGKYCEIIASPIWDESKDRTLLAVLTVDRALTEGDDNRMLHLNSAMTRETVQSVCRVIGTQWRQS
ncbi:hypothetical protein E3T28_15910 [Cryobacterium sinapicolor]|uniref:IclR-ED domain-containing protein n=1 Tax=Cryobacterium sinapicolor TaxID=1259236 RepID=A0ABY2IUW1_9MICO|nr:hypothetical protein [Cryobacterium sinapicolor]TFC94040.1 hypothetical protein E3T28_15910 [Cryobacterium sinapicolor]